jgi:hypothetical protein
LRAIGVEASDRAEQQLVPRLLEETHGPAADYIAATGDTKGAITLIRTHKDRMSA